MMWVCVERQRERLHNTEGREGDRERQREMKKDICDNQRDTKSKRVRDRPVQFVSVRWPTFSGLISKRRNTS